NSSSLNHLARSSAGIFRRLSISRLDVRSDWHSYTTGNVGHSSNHAISWDLLPIRETLRERNPRAGSSDGGKSGVFDDAPAGDVPDIGEHNRLAASMHRKKFFGFLSLFGFRHTGLGCY